MSSPSPPFKAGALALSLGILATLVLVATGSALFGTKMGRVFPMSADALAGSANAAPRRLEPTDAGTDPSDGGAKRPRLSPLGATKAAPVFRAEDMPPVVEQKPAPSPTQSAK